jgi:GTPase SAR1 family protein
MDDPKPDTRESPAVPAKKEPEPEPAPPQPRKQFRILLLGAGESGKTTFTQQLSLLHNLTSVSAEERKRSTLTALHENIVQCISATAANAVRLGIELSPEDKERLESIKMSTRFDKVVADDVETLWRGEAMQKSYAQKSKYWVLDTADWLIDNVQRFASEDYVPERQDMVLSRRRTTGITEHTYVVDDSAFTIIDVGGQRSERRKWVQFFADVHCIVFFVSVIGFCKVLFEDRNTFQMKESLELFSSTFRVPAPQTGPRVDNDWQDYVFETTPIHVVFNKLDMLAPCLEKYALSACFPAYKGPNAQASVLRFLQQTFADRVVSIRSPPDTHFISAANSDDVQELFTKLSTFLVEKEKAGLALNAFMALEQKTGGMRTNALDRRPQKPAAKPQDDISKKRQRQRLKRIRELMCEN